MDNNKQMPIVNIDIHDNQNVTVNPALTELHQEMHFHGTMQEPSPKDDPLGTFVLQKVTYDQVIAIANTCEKPSDILDKLVPLLLNAAGLKPEVIRGIGFRKAILPHLTKYTGINDNSLRQILKDVR